VKSRHAVLRIVLLLALVDLVIVGLIAGCGASFEQWSVQDAVDAFEAAGLECEDRRAMTKDDYGVAPMVATEGTRFLIPSLCEDCGGRIMSFASQGDLDATKAYYDELGKTSAAFFSWTFASDNILVQINGDLPEPQARAYEQALRGLGE